MKNKTSKIFSAVYFACIISCILLSALLVSEVWARYFSEASGNDGARVAKFEVQLKPAESQEDMKFDGSTHNGDAQELIYNFSVISNSEVTVDYSITVEFANPLPANMSVQIDGQAVQDGDDSKTAFSFEGGTIALNETQRDHQLKITVIYKNNENVIEKDFDTSVKVIVHAEQVD